MKFLVYPKGKNDQAPIELDCEGLNRDGLFMRPLNLQRQPSEFGLFAISKIGAILPDPPNPPPHKMSPPLHFQVYLHGRTNPLEIQADSFEVKEDEILFIWLTYNMKTQERIVTPVEGTYVAVSEVVAVIPSERLPGRNAP